MESQQDTGSPRNLSHTSLGLYAKRFGFDVRAIVADLREKEQAHPDRLVSFAPKSVRSLKTA
jgi:hypothetical protein